MERITFNVPKPYTVTFSELLAGSGASASQIEHWTTSRLIVPLYEPLGRGNPREWSVENLIEATEALELAKAGFSVSQMKPVFEAQRTRRARMSPVGRISQVYADYIETIENLVRIFGPFEGFKGWLKTQQAVLAGLVAVARLEVKGHAEDDLTAKVNTLLGRARSESAAIRQ